MARHVRYKGYDLYRSRLGRWEIHKGTTYLEDRGTLKKAKEWVDQKAGK